MSILGWLERSRARCGVAFASDYLLVQRWNSGGSGSIETRRRDLPGDLMSVSAVEPNIKAVSRIAQLIEELLDDLGGIGQQVALVLPDLAVRAFIFPSDVRASRGDLMSEISPRLSYPQVEAQMDTWKAPAGWTLAVAVRNVVLRQYEQALEALGCHVVWVDGASLIPIPGWAKDAWERSSKPSSPGGPGDMGISVHVQLFPGHYTSSVMRMADLLDIRTKLRDSGDELRIAEHVLRLPKLLEAERCDRIFLDGHGAGDVAGHLEGAGFSMSDIHLGALDEEAHLTNLLETLLKRI